jgi:hypothetical protein
MMEKYCLLSSLYFTSLSKCDKLTRNYFSSLEKACKEEKDCSAIDAKTCAIDDFKEELEKKCPRKCRVPECVDSKECQNLNVTKELCNVLHEKCPNICAKYND